MSTTATSTTNTATAAPAAGAASAPAPASSTPPAPGSSSSPSPPAASASTTATTTTTPGSSAQSGNDNSSITSTSSKPIPALPAPDHASSADSEEGTRIVQVNGQAVALDKLGPMVVGRDGTVSRIANWPEMTELERQNTLRILCKRNQLRLANLRAGRPADEKPAPEAEAEAKESS